MTKPSFLINNAPPSVDDFIRLRQRVGWGNLDAKLAKKSLEHALFNVTVYYRDVLVGMGRIVGDGYMYFYLQDVVVDPDHQNLGIGKLIMNELEAYLDLTAHQGSTVGLLSAKGKEGFYRNYLYEERCGVWLGMGMSKFV